VNQAIEEGAGGQHHRPRGEAHAELADDAGDLVTVDDQIVASLRADRQVRLLLEPAANRLPIQHPVGLRARRAHRRTLARIENAELDTGFVGRLGHCPTERIDLLDEVAFADAADRRIAAHRPQGIEVVRQQQGPHARTCGGKRRLGAGVATTDDNYLETVRKQHGQSGRARAAACAKDRDSTPVR